MHYTDISSRKSFLYLGVILAVIVLLRVFSVAIPFFNVDEAGTAVAADSILDGGVIYRDVIEHRGPLLSYIYALIFAVGGRYNMAAVRIAFILLLLVFSIILYRIGVEVGNRKVGVWAVLFFSAFSITINYEAGQAFNAEWLAIFFSILGVFFCLRWVLRYNGLLLFLSGICWGLAFFTKQPALLDFAVTVLFCVSYLFISRRPAREILQAAAVLAGGFSLVAALVVFYLFSQRALQDFWFYFWVYNSKYYVAAIPLLERIRLAVTYPFSSDSIFTENVLISILFIASFFITAFKVFKNGRQIDRDKLIDCYFIALFISAYAGASSSGRTFSHYYLSCLLPLCLIGAKTIQGIFDASGPLLSDNLSEENKAVPASSHIKIFLAAVLIVGLSAPFAKWYFLIRREYMNSFKKSIAFVYNPELYALTNYIKENSGEKEKIFVWGWYPDIYALSKRKPASRYTSCNFLTGLIPLVHLDEPNFDTTKDIVPRAWTILMEELRNNKPLYIIDTTYAGQGAYYKYPPEKFPELNDFINAYYAPEKIFYNKERGLALKLLKRR